MNKKIIEFVTRAAHTLYIHYILLYIFMFCGFLLLNTGMLRRQAVSRPRSRLRPTKLALRPRT